MEFMATFMVFMAFMVESLGAMAALGRRWMHLQVVAQASLGLWNGFQKKESKHMITCINMKLLLIVIMETHMVLLSWKFICYINGSWGDIEVSRDAT